MDFHPLADIFPLLEGEEFASLVDDALRGTLFPLVEFRFRASSKTRDQDLPTALS